MNFIQLKPKPRPYSANSTGRPRGTLNLGTRLGRVQVYEAVGEARTIFMEKLCQAIVAYLNDNNDKLKDSTSFVDLSLFMMGRSPDRTKPIVMFVSDDKQARTEAFRVIKHSGIMDDFPGFGLGEMELKAEFENLRPLGSQPTQATSFFFVPKDTVHVRMSEPSASGVQRLAVHTHDGGESFAVAQGIFSYKGRYYLHSANHALQFAPEAQASGAQIPQATAPDNMTEEECEIMGLSDEDGDGEDEDYCKLVNITSRGSASPAASDGEGTMVDSSESDTRERPVPLSGICSNDLDAPTLSLTEPHKTPSERPETPYSGKVHVQVGLMAGRVVLRSAVLDSAFVDLGGGGNWNGSLAGLTKQAMPIEHNHLYTENTGPSDALIEASTPDGTILGILSGTSSFVRLPGTKIFQEVYVAMLDRPLAPGDSGSWVKHAATGKLFGHVIAGSSTTGLVLLMPAYMVFSSALKALEALSFTQVSAVGSILPFMHKPSHTQSSTSSAPSKRFACPFHKKDPIAYNVDDHNICALRSWESVSRLKQVTCATSSKSDR